MGYALGGHCGPSSRQSQTFLVVFVDCYSRYTILVPASNRTASTVSDALLRHVIPYFSPPRRLLSDRGRKFVGDVWGRLMCSLGVQRVLTSPYHPEGNAVNERSHRTMNNMLRARLLEGTSSMAWVEMVPGLMLTLNAMVHEPHGFSASMVATGREPTLPPDLQNDACASLSLDDPTDYVEVLRQRLSLTHQQMTAPPPPASANPHQEGSLIFMMTTPPERANKLTPRWKGPFRVKRVPNPYQVVYENGSVWRTVHVHHTKPAKSTAPGLPLPTPALSLPGQHLGISLGVFSDCALVLLPWHQYPRRLLFRLPRVRGLLVAQHRPLETRHHIRSLPPPPRPSRIPNLFFGHGDLQG